MGLLDMALTVESGAVLVPYGRDATGDQAMLFEMPANVLGRPIQWDISIGYGRHKGMLLSQLNSHEASFLFRGLAGKRAGPAVLQAVWDLGLAMLTPKRVNEGHADNQLVNMWAGCRRYNVDPGSDLFSGLATNYTEEDIEAVLESVALTLLAYTDFYGATGEEYQKEPLL